MMRTTGTFCVGAMLYRGASSGISASSNNSATTSAGLLKVGSRGAAVEWCGPRPGHPEHFDFSTVQARLQHVLDADPEALFHLRVHVEMQPWWQELYPDECERGPGEPGGDTRTKPYWLASMSVWF